MPERFLGRLAVLVFVMAGSVAGQEARVPPRPSGPTDGCVTSECHSEIASGQFVHGPAAQRKCDACHTTRSIVEHTFDLSRPAEQLCETCHTISKADYLHQPVREGACTGCHDPHGSGFRFMLVADPAAGLCQRCHEPGEYESKKFVHGPVAAGACILCHESHGSWRAHLLVAPGRDLCLQCHWQVEEHLRRMRHAHKPVAEGACTECHDPHASDSKMQLKEAPMQLCLSCHDQIATLLEGAKYVHGAVLEPDSCTSCHFGHGTDLPKLLRKPLLENCLGCHDRRMETAEGEVLEDMATLLKENPNHHGPVRNADCSACHNPHASGNFRLLAREYPAEFYAPFAIETYELCFACHLKEMVLVKYGPGITGFSQQTEDGLLNLHYLHVNKQDKGRTCRACHEVHASKRPAHIRESVPFGKNNWPLEINFTQHKDGGSCAPGCHKAQEYHRPASVPRGAVGGS